MRLYGRGIGYHVRGIVINQRIYRYERDGRPGPGQV